MVRATKIRRMGKKKRGEKNDTTFQFCVRREELDAFRHCAKAEGFGSLAAWILWLLRRRVKEVLGEQKRD